MSPGLRVRRAGAADGEAVAGVAESVRFHPGTADGGVGYLVYIQTAAEYAVTLGRPGAASWVAEDESRGILGFLWCEPMESGAWYVEQIGIHPDARGQGLAAALYDRMVQDLQPLRLECEIMHAPLLKSRSQHFFEQRGWLCVEEKRDGDFVWGRYAWEGCG